MGNYTENKLELKLSDYDYITSSSYKVPIWKKKLLFQNEDDQRLFREFIEKTFGITTQKPTRRRMPERKPWQWLAPLASCDETPSDEIIKRNERAELPLFVNYIMVI